MEHKTYAEKLLDPRWQKRKSEIMTRDNFTCTNCTDKTKTLHVHHKKYYKGFEPWEYDDTLLTTLCSTCHKNIHFPVEAEPEYIMMYKFEFDNPTPVSECINMHINNMTEKLLDPNVSDTQKDEILLAVIYYRGLKKYYTL